MNGPHRKYVAVDRARDLVVLDLTAWLESPMRPRGLVVAGISLSPEQATLLANELLAAVEELKQPRKE